MMDVNEAAVVAEKYERYNELQQIYKEVREARLDINYDSDRIHLGFTKAGEEIRLPIPRKLADQTVAQVEAIIEEELLKIRDDIDKIQINFSK